MSEWIEAKIKDLGSVITGSTPSSKYPDDFGRYLMFVTPTDFKNYTNFINKTGRYLSKIGVKKLSTRLIPKNSTMVTCIGSDMGKVALNPTEVITNQQINSIIPYSSVDNIFLYYKLKDEYDTLRSYGGEGTAVPIVNKSTFENIVLTIPKDKFEQESIAEVLSSLDDKIDLLHRNNKTLEQLAETLYRQWFVEDLNESWENGKLSDLVNIKYGKDHKLLAEGNIPVYGSGGLMRFANKALYSKESVLIPRKGTLSNIMLVQEPFWTVDTMFYTEMKMDNLAKFIYHFINSQDVASMNVGSAVPSLTTEILNNIDLKIPSTSILKKYEEQVSVLFDKKNQNNKSIKILELLRDTLLPKLMNGVVRVVD